MLKPVEKSREFKGAIDEARNYNLEATLIGKPLWLYNHGHESEAQQVMSTIAKQPRELFVRHTHRLLWDAYEVLRNRDRPPTEAWIQQALADEGGWSENEEQGAVVTPGLLDELAEQGSCKLTMKIGDSPMIRVRELISELWSLYRKRQVIHSVEDLYRQVTGQWNEGTEPEIAGAIDSVLHCFNERPAGEKSASFVNELVNAHIVDLERQMAGEEPDSILTGFPSIDRLTGGMLPGNLIVLAGTPSMGKTALALTIGLNVSKSQKFVALFSHEMGRKELIQRIVAQELRINVLRMRHGNLEDWQMDQYRNRFGDGWQLPLLIDEANYTPAGIEARIRDFNRMAPPVKVEFVVIDHLQLMGSKDLTRYERRDRQIATYTGQLKDMAKRLSVPVLLLSQLNRQSENRPINERLPRLSDLRESGAIAADADVVLGIYRKYVDTKDSADEPHAVLIIMKNRSGPTGKLSLSWVPQLAMFTDPAGSNSSTEQCHDGIDLSRI